MIDRFENLEVLRVAHEVVIETCQLSAEFPIRERYGLTAQLRRAAVAIPTNIIEGGARGHRKEYLNFCYIARGSAAELRYLLRVASDLGLLQAETGESVNSKLKQVLRMLNGLIRSLRRPNRESSARP